MNKIVKRLLIAIACIVVCSIQLIPFYMMVNISLKKVTDYASVISIPDYLYLENYSTVWEQANLGVAFKNNLIITVSTLALLILVASMASYPLARVDSRLNRFVYTLFISCMIIPTLTLMVPLYRLLIDIKLVNTLQGAILVKTAFTIPLCVFLYTGFIRGLPKEIDEAGYIDGANKVQIFYTLLFPLLKPVTASVIILQGVSIWNEYGIFLYILQDPKVQVLTVTLNRFIGENQSRMNWIAAGCLMASIPVIIMYLVFQKHFVKGMASSAVKG